MAVRQRLILRLSIKDGNPADNAKVDFKIYNYAEFYTAVSKYTGADGTTFLSAGKGDMIVWASKDQQFWLC